jgi:hypothetical protein
VDLVTVAVALSLNAVSRSHEPIPPDADAPAVRFSRGGAVSLIWIIAGPFRCCRLRRSGCSVVLRSSKDREQV